MNGQKRMIMERTVDELSAAKLRLTLWGIATKYSELRQYFSSGDNVSPWSVIDNALALKIQSDGAKQDVFTFQCEKLPSVRQESHFVVGSYRINIVGTDLITEGSAFQFRIIHKNSDGDLLSHLLIQISNSQAADTISDELSEETGGKSVITEVTLNSLLYLPYSIAQDL